VAVADTDTLAAGVFVGVLLEVEVCESDTVVTEKVCVLETDTIDFDAVAKDAVRDTELVAELVVRLAVWTDLDAVTDIVNDSVTEPVRLAVALTEDVPVKDAVLVPELVLV
jgi:hypothetical protein